MRGERLIGRLSKRKGMMMTRKLRTRGTDNVLVDLGFDDAKLSQGHACDEIECSARNTGPDPSPSLEDTRHAAAQNLGDQKHKLRGVSLERLMQALTMLGQHVGSTARIDVGA